MPRIPWFRKLFGFFRHGQRPITRPLSFRQQPRLIVLEDRLSPAVLTVNTTDTTDQRDDFLSLTESLRVINGTIAFDSLTAAEKVQITGGTPGTNDTIVLTADTYTLTTIDNYWYAPNGLGFIASTVPPFVTWAIGYHFFKINPAVLMGGVAGARSHSGPCREAAKEINSSVPWVGFPVGYAVSGVLYTVFGYFAMVLSQ